MNSTKISLIKEDPDTVYARPVLGLENDLHYYKGPNSGFIVYSTKIAPSEIKYVYTTSYLDGNTAGTHRMCRELIQKREGYDDKEIDFDDVINQYIMGRIWIRQWIASTYQPSNVVKKYKTQIESIFEEMGLDIYKFRWDFNNDTGDGEFDNWSDVSDITPPKKEIDPKIKAKINHLIGKLHLSTPDEKVKIRSLIQKYQKEADIGDTEIDSYINASQEKLAAASKGYNSVAAANFYNRSSIAETVLRVYNKTLDPNIWNNDKTIKTDIREHLLKIAGDFYNSTELEGEIHDILFIGSSANYNWTSTSDIDLHVVIDIAEEKINEEYARKFMDSLGFKFNTEHDIEIKGHPVEVYIQDIREPNSTAQLSREGAAIYSLFDGRWIQEPNPKKIDFDADKIRKKFQTIEEKAKKLVDTNDIEKLKELMKSIRKYRDSGLAKGGEFCTENLVFKALRKSGVLEKIKSTINKVYDQQVSLPEHGNMQPKTDTSKLNEDTRPFTLVGGIKPDFQVYSLKDYNDKSGHNNVPEYKREDKRWRYNSKKNVVYWDYSVCADDDATDEDKESVSHHLKKKYGIVNPTHKLSYEYYSHGHNINESKENYLIIGIVNKDLEIISKQDFKGDESHEWLLKQNPPFDYDHETSAFWRYKSSNNTIYWQDNPTEQQKFTVSEYLKDKFGIINPRETHTTDLSGHTITETLEEVMSLMESKGSGLFFKPSQAVG